MREIKFRALDKNKHWIYGLPYFDFANGIWYITHTNGWIPTYNNPDEGEYTIRTEIEPKTLTEFIGLEDKNGKEIYEEDIIKVKMFNYENNGEKTFIYETYRVVWQQDKMRFGLIDVKEYECADSWAFTSENDFEIIGNIYETPELLK